MRKSKKSKKEETITKKKVFFDGFACDKLANSFVFPPVFVIFIALFQFLYFENAFDEQALNHLIFFTGYLVPLGFQLKDLQKKKLNKNFSLLTKLSPIRSQFTLFRLILIIKCYKRN